MIISGNTTGFRSFYGQDDNFAFSFYVNSQINYLKVGVTGQSNPLWFTFSSGRVYDPSGRFVDSFPSVQYSQYKIESKFKSGYYEYSINDRIISRENGFSGYYDSFVVQNLSTGDADLDFYLSGQKPALSYSGLYGISGLSGRFVNNGKYPVKIYNVSSEENYSWLYSTGSIASGQTGYFYTTTGFSYQTGSNLTVDFVFNFGEESKLFNVYSGAGAQLNETSPVITYLSNYSGQPPYLQNGATGLYRIFYKAPTNTNLQLYLDYNVGRTGIAGFTTGYPFTGLVDNTWLYGNGGASGSVTVGISHGRVLRYVIDYENTGVFTGVSTTQTFNVPFRYFTGVLEYELESSGVNTMYTTLPSGYSTYTDFGGYSGLAQLQAAYVISATSKQNHILTGNVTGQSQSGRYRFSTFSENITGSADLYSTINDYVDGNMAWTGYAVSGLAVARLNPYLFVGNQTSIPFTGTDYAGRSVTGLIGGTLYRYIPNITYSGIYDFRGQTVSGRLFLNEEFEQLSGIYFDYIDPVDFFSSDLNFAQVNGTEVYTYDLTDARLASFTGIVPNYSDSFTAWHGQYGVGVVEYEKLSDKLIQAPRTTCRYYFTTGALSGFYLEKEKFPSNIISDEYGQLDSYSPLVNKHVFNPTVATAGAFLAKRTVYVTGTEFTGNINVTGILQSGYISEYLTTTVDYSGQAPFTKTIINVWSMATGSSPTGTFVDLASQGKYSLATIYDNFNVSGTNELYAKIVYNGRGYSDIYGNVDMATLSVYGGYDTVVSLDITGVL